MQEVSAEYTAKVVLDLISGEKGFMQAGRRQRLPFDSRLEKGRKAYGTAD